MSRSNRKDVSRRVAGIHGHVHAIRKMLDEGRPYSEIAHQISAVRAALDSVTQVMVDEMVRDCVERAREKKPFEEILVELQKVIASN